LARTTRETAAGREPGTAADPARLERSQDAAPGPPRKRPRRRFLLPVTNPPATRTTADSRPHLPSQKFPNVHGAQPLLRRPPRGPASGADFPYRLQSLRQPSPQRTAVRIFHRKNPGMSTAQNTICAGPSTAPPPALISATGYNPSGSTHHCGRPSASSIAKIPEHLRRTTAPAPAPPRPQLRSGSPFPVSIPPAAHTTADGRPHLPSQHSRNLPNAAKLPQRNVRASVPGVDFRYRLQPFRLSPSFSRPLCTDPRGDPGMSMPRRSCHRGISAPPVHSCVFISGSRAIGKQ
jgi:hypothetical protein